jgi:hypothetical protein
MSDSTESWSEYTPDWTRIKKLAENLDKALDDGIKDGMNFIEIDIAFYMVKEKLQQEKHRVLTETFEAESIKETQKNNQFYG